MRIVQAAGWYFPESIGGTEIYVAGLAAALRERGHDVHVAVPAPGAAAASESVHEGVPVFRYPIPAVPTRAEAQGAVAARGAAVLHEWMARLRPDLVHVHTFVTGLGLHELRAARAAGARVMVTSHSAALGWLCARGTMLQGGTVPCDGIAEVGKCTDCLLEQRGASAPVRALLRRWPRRWSRTAAVVPGRVGTALGLPAFLEANQARQRALFEEAEVVTVLTQWAADALVANGAPRDRILVNRLGVTGHWPRKPGPAERPTTSPITVLFVGRLEPIKGASVLAAALRRLPDELPLRVRVHGVVQSAADAAERAALERVAAVDPRLEVATALPRAAVAGALAAADLLCCPSMVLEGGPTVALEAHAVGTPVIGARIGGLAEIVEEGRTGALVPPGDAGALAALLDTLVRDPGQVDRWREALPAPRTMAQICDAYLERLGVAA